MTLQQIFYFCEVAKELHFTRAAENLYVAQSSLSNSIRDLEAEIGAPLFLRRNGKRIELTRYGKVFLPHAQKMLEALSAGQAELEQLVSPNSGNVTFAYSYLIGCNFIPALLDAFYADEGNRQINIRPYVNHGGRAFIEESLALCTADIAISGYPFSESKNVCSQKIATLEHYAAIPIGHPLAAKNAISLDEIRDERIIMFSGSMGLYDFVVQLFESAGISANYVDGCTDWSAMIMEVARGNGVAIVPKLEVSLDKVAYIPLAGAASKRDIFLLWPKERKLSKAAEHVRRFCLDYSQK